MKLYKKKLNIFNWPRVYEGKMWDKYILMQESMYKYFVNQDSKRLGVYNFSVFCFSIVFFYQHWLCRNLISHSKYFELQDSLSWYPQIVV